MLRRLNPAQKSFLWVIVLRDADEERLAGIAGVINVDTPSLSLEIAGPVLVLKPFQVSCPKHRSTQIAGQGNRDCRERSDCAACL